MSSQNHQKIKSFFEQALKYKKSGNLYESIELYKKSIELDQNIYEAYFNISNIYEEIGDYDSAIKYLSIAKDLNQNDYEINVNLGNLFIHKQMFKEAMQQFQIAFTKNQIDPRISNSVGMLQRKFNDNVNAKKAFEYTLSIDKNNDFAIRQLSIIERILGNYKVGLELLYKLTGKISLK